jgi:hypothetical protein
MANKKMGIIAGILFAIAACTAFAQSTSDVQKWLNGAERDAQKAYDLVRSKHAKEKMSDIQTLLQSSVRQLVEVQNAFSSNPALYDDSRVDRWVEKMQRIQADLNSVSQLLSLL